MTALNRGGKLIWCERFLHRPNGRFRKKKWQRHQILQFCGDYRRIRREWRLNYDMHTPHCRSSPHVQNCKVWGRCHLLRNHLLDGHFDWLLSGKTGSEQLHTLMHFTLTHGSFRSTRIKMQSSIALVAMATVLKRSSSTQKKWRYTCVLLNEKFYGQGQIFRQMKHVSTWECGVTELGVVEHQISTARAEDELVVSRDEGEVRHPTCFLWSDDCRRFDGESTSGRWRPAKRSHCWKKQMHGDEARREVKPWNQKIVKAPAKKLPLKCLEAEDLGKGVKFVSFFTIQHSVLV